MKVVLMTAFFLPAVYIQCFHRGPGSPEFPLVAYLLSLPFNLRWLCCLTPHHSDHDLQQVISPKENKRKNSIWRANCEEKIGGGWIRR